MTNTTTVSTNKGWRSLDLTPNHSGGVNVSQALSPGQGQGTESNGGPPIVRPPFRTQRSSSVPVQQNQSHIQSQQQHVTNNVGDSRPDVGTPVSAAKVRHRLSHNASCLPPTNQPARPLDPSLLFLFSVSFFLYFSLALSHVHSFSLCPIPSSLSISVSLCPHHRRSRPLPSSLCFSTI